MEERPLGLEPADLGACTHEALSPHSLMQHACSVQVNVGMSAHTHAYACRFVHHLVHMCMHGHTCPCVYVVYSLPHMDLYVCACMCMCVHARLCSFFDKLRAFEPRSREGPQNLPAWFPCSGPSASGFLEGSHSALRTFLQGHLPSKAFLSLP